MANRTVKEAISIKGTNPQYLVEKIIRSRIYDSRYWKEECFALTAELLVDKAIELKAVGGCYGGNTKPTPFLCLVLKMLQIQPEKDIIIEFIRNEEFKYVRALGAIYMRLTGNSVDVHKYLEPLYLDYRKMKRMNKDAKYELLHMDEFIDELLHSDRVCDISLPRLQKRIVLEERNELEPKISPLDVNLDDAESSSASSSESSESETEEENDVKKKEKSTKSSNNRRRDSENRDDYSKTSRSRRDDDRNNQRKGYKYVDYDNPNPDDEIARYKRSRSRENRERRSKYSSRSRSRSRDRHSHHRRHKSSGKNRHSSRERRRRSRSKERIPSRDRNRSKSSTSASSESRSRTRSRERDSKKDRHHHHHKSSKKRRERDQS
jgi:pre-mRNA-splicing factor 38A